MTTILDSKQGQPGRTIVARLSPGSQLTQALEQLCTDYGVHTAYIASIIGTVDEVYFRNPKDTTTFPIRHEHEWADEIDTIHLQRHMEILSIQGNITTSEGQLWAHCHGLFSEAGATVRGGHIFRARIWSQGEVVLQEILGMQLVRERDLEVTGLPQIQFRDA
jgi:predicted DNA-binding protein with PD1-like motif